MDFKFTRVEKQSTRYAFSANSKEIKILGEFYDKDSDIIREEAILVRQQYVDEVNACKARGEKPKPSSIKSQAFAKAKEIMSTKYGEIYFNLISDKKVKEITPKKSKNPIEENKEIDTQEVQSINDKYIEDTEALLDEFDNDVTDVPKVKLKEIDLERLGSIAPGSTFREPKDLVEVDPTEEVAAERVENLDIFDMEVDTDDLFDF